MRQSARFFFCMYVFPRNSYTFGGDNMKKFRVYAFWIILAEVVGALSGWLIRDSIGLYRDAILKPPLSPPGIVFPIVWGILYALMGIGAAMIYRAPASEQRTSSLQLYMLQLAVNFLWPIFFFRMQSFGGALILLGLLWGLVLWMLLSFRKVSPLAAKLQIPYLIWLTFAAYLNAGVWVLNQ